MNNGAVRDFDMNIVHNAPVDLNLPKVFDAVMRTCDVSLSRAEAWCAGKTGGSAVWGFRFMGANQAASAV